MELLDKCAIEQLRYDFMKAHCEKDGCNIWLNNFLAVNNMGEIKSSTGRAKCRITGKKIPKGDLEIVFPHDPEGRWQTAIEYHVSIRELLNEP